MTASRFSLTPSQSRVSTPAILNLWPSAVSPSPVCQRTSPVTDRPARPPLPGDCAQAGPSAGGGPRALPRPLQEVPGEAALHQPALCALLRWVSAGGGGGRRGMWIVVVGLQLSSVPASCMLVVIKLAKNFDMSFTKNCAFRLRHIIL